MVATPGAGRTVRSLVNPASMVGATLDQVRAMVPEGWIERPLAKLSGVRFLAPGSTPGSRGYIEYVEGGAPGAGVGEPAGPIHQGGNFLGVRVGGLNYWAAGKGNAVIEEPEALATSSRGRAAQARST